MKNKKEIFWVQSYDRNGDAYAAQKVDSWEEALRVAKDDRDNAADYAIEQVCVWPNRVDPDFGDQPDYSGDWLWAWKRGDTHTRYGVIGQKKAKKHGRSAASEMGGTK